MPFRERSLQSVVPFSARRISNPADPGRFEKTSYDSHDPHDRRPLVWICGSAEIAGSEKWRNLPMPGSCRERHGRSDCLQALAPEVLALRRRRRTSRKGQHAQGCFGVDRVGWSRGDVGFGECSRPAVPPSAFLAAAGPVLSAERRVRRAHRHGASQERLAASDVLWAMTLATNHARSLSERNSE